MITETLYPENTGGVPRTASFLADELGQRGCEVVVITRTLKPAAPDFAAVSREHVTVVEYRNDSPFWFVRTAAMVERAIERFPELLGRFDMIYAHFPYSVRAIRRRFPEAVFVLNIHSPLLEEGVANRGIRVAPVLLPLQYYYELAAVRACAHIVVYSEYLRDLLGRKYGKLAGDKITIHHNGIVVVHPAPDELERVRDSYGLRDRRVFVCSRRHVRRTGVLELVEALVGGPPSDARFVFTGSGYLFETLKKKARGRPDILFTGRLEDREVHALYEIAEASIVPTRDLECFGLSTVESLFHGTPVVVSDRGANPEVVAKLGGGIVVPFGVEPFKRALRELLEGSFTFPPIDEARLAEFTFETQASEVMGLIEPALREAGRGS